jgi:A/G-specific adenine glycosylase
MPRRLAQHATQAELDRARVAGSKLAHWYKDHGRTFAWREWRDEYKTAVVELLLQRTRAESVAPFVLTFFDTYTDWASLARTDTRTLERVLAPLGLYRRRARALRALARSVLSEPRRPWAQRPGVGQYIERALGVNVHGRKLAMIDSNFVRVLHRLFAGEWMAEYRTDPRLQALSLALVRGAEDPRAVNWAVFDLAASVCRPKPVCDACPLVTLCAAATKQVEAMRGSRGVSWKD